jgi:hypothetical protein
VAATGAAIVDAAIIIASVRMVATGMVQLLFSLSLLKSIMLYPYKGTNAKDKRLLLIERLKGISYFLVIVIVIKQSVNDILKGTLAMRTHC